MIQARGRAYRTRLLLAAALGALIMAAGMLPGPQAGGQAFAQEAPALQFHTRYSLPMDVGPGQYDILQFVLTFDPGESTPVHRVAGPTLITVLEGEAQLVSADGEVEETFHTGQSWLELTDDEFDYDINMTASQSQILVTFLLQPGGPPLIIHPSVAQPGPDPDFSAVSRVSLGTQPGGFVLTHGIVDLPPGGIAELRSYPGVKVATELGGNQAVVALITTEEPHSAPSSPAAPSITPPSTGDGGLAGR